MRSEEIDFALKNTNPQFLKMCFLLLILLIKTTFTHGIDRNGEMWANGSDFPENNLTNIIDKPLAQCGRLCSRNKEFTHYIWTNFNGGTCWMKKGTITRKDGVPKYAENALYEVPVVTSKFVLPQGDEYSCESVCEYYENNSDKFTNWQKCVEKSDAMQSEKSSCGIVTGTYPVLLSGRSTRYWDCRKPSCALPRRAYGAYVTKPVATCSRDGDRVLSSDGGTAYMCNNNIPWKINDTLSYGFAAANIISKTEADWCCKCYHLTFTSPPVKGKKMIVQVTSSSGNFWENHFSLQIPGGGVGSFNGCFSQWSAPYDGWGDRYGGVRNATACDELPLKIRRGCKWWFRWFKGADNPRFEFFEIECPKEITDKTGCVRI